MKTTITPTPLDGVVIVEINYVRDERGFFVESWHERDFANAGIREHFVQDNHSRSSAWVLRGLHYQDMSAPMGKLIRCTEGKIFDVAVDLRVGSPTFAKWFGIELSLDNLKQIFIPPGFAHGFVTLTEFAQVQYKCTGFYTPSAEGALAWNDPDIAIHWPVTDPVLSPRDQNGMSLRQYLEKPAFHYQR